MTNLPQRHDGAPVDYARKQLRDTGIIWIRWSIIGLLVCFWIAVANNWPWISATVAEWL